jgi:hypothetical protein
MGVKVCMHVQGRVCGWGGWAAASVEGQLCGSMMHACKLHGCSLRNCILRFVHGRIRDPLRAVAHIANPCAPPSHTLCPPPATHPCPLRVSLDSPDGSPLIRELSFEVARGVNVLLMGPNGCGKSRWEGPKLRRPSGSTSALIETRQHTCTRPAWRASLWPVRFHLASRLFCNCLAQRHLPQHHPGLDGLLALTTRPPPPSSQPPPFHPALSPPPMTVCSALWQGCGRCRRARSACPRRAASST